MSQRKSIGKLLLEFGLINEDDLKEGLAFQKETGLKLGEALVKLRRVSMEDINWALSKQLDIPFVTVEDIIPDNALFAKFKKEFLLINKMVPLYETDDQISVVAEDPFNETAVDVIEDSFNKKVNIATGSGKKIEELLKTVYGKTVSPELFSSLEDVIKRIQDTSFYRIDFLMGENSCSINVFGFGILKNVLTVQGTCTVPDICNVFDGLHIPFLYHQSAANSSTFLAVYPLVNRLEISGMPAILGKFGLHLPEEITFSDAYSCGLPRFFHHDRPVPGYEFYSTGQQTEYDKSMYLIDLFPQDFKDHYVNICIPEECPVCHGTGCGSCRDLGYEFREIEGMYSSEDLKKVMKEDVHGKD